MECSYAKLNSLQFGRQSYQKFNGEIEVIQNLYHDHHCDVVT